MKFLSVLKRTLRKVGKKLSEADTMAEDVTVPQKKNIIKN